MRRVLGLVLAAQAAGNLGGEAAEHLVVRIDEVPVMAHVLRLGGKGLHRLHFQWTGCRAPRARIALQRGSGTSGGRRSRKAEYCISSRRSSAS
jgi:hypothetical protein